MQFNYNITLYRPEQWSYRCETKTLRRGADKSLAFPIFRTTNNFFLDGLKKLEQRSHKYVELSGEYVEEIYLFSPVALLFSL
jgi:hypothetical protein